MCKRNFLLTTAILFGILLSSSKALLAQGFVSPEELVQFGHTYTLVNKQVTPGGLAIYQFTTNGEPIEKWTTLITLLYYKGAQYDPTKWGMSVKAEVDRSNPKPQYETSVIGANGYARLIFEPDSAIPFYESNVSKSFHSSACGGLVVLQYSVKYPKSEDQSDSGRMLTLESIRRDNERMSIEVQESDWSPTCQ